MKLPIVLSVPHAGLRVADEVAELCRLTADEIRADSDGTAREVYALSEHVEAFVTTDIARAVVDMNRAEDDRRPDGIVKTHTCWNVPIYAAPLPDELAEALIDRYHRPYHAALAGAARLARVRLGVDGHTMAAVGPPVGPDHGRERPWVCVGDGRGTTCPAPWIEVVVARLAAQFGGEHVTLDDPFAGGHIVRVHAPELPWVQIEVSRAPFLPPEEKRRRILRALEEMARELFA